MVILTLRPVSVVRRTNVASMVLALWGTYTTSEKEVLPCTSADKMRSPICTSAMALDAPFSSVTTSEPAKQALEAVLVPTVLVTGVAAGVVAVPVVVRPDPMVGAMEVVHAGEICVC